MGENVSLAALNRAMEFEREGIKYYSQAMEKTQHPTARSIFEMLVEEEKRHIDYLEKLYDRLRAEGNWPDEITINIDKDFKLIFKEAAEDIDTSVGVTTDELEALDFAFNMESKGRAMYLELSGKATNPKEKELYELLARWELGHAGLVEDFYNYYQDRGLFTEE